ncbi:MAG: rhomboid family intramembrane serine protease [Chitinophagaceae bacterium]|nr:rhomboid family intramembrane serine protease [Chitinophagaceae bacterium]
MFTPIGDDNSDRRIKPYVNYMLILLNLLVFFVLQGAGSNLAFTYAFASVPAEILTGTDIVTEAQRFVDEYTNTTFEIPGLQVTPIPVYLTLFTSMFMHGGIGHLIGNMLYLWIFGDNLENRMGHGRYLAFYLITGVLAALSHVFSIFLIPGSELIPMIGASGAISGVLGGNIILLPHRRITVLIGIWPFQVSALFALGMWIVFQFINGLGALGSEGDGVAYAAHIGGFVAGVILVKFFDNGKDPEDREIWIRRVR